MQTDLHKKNELDYFFVEESYGGNQDLFPEIAMRDGGCVQWQLARAVFILPAEQVSINCIRINLRRLHGKNIMILHIL